MSLVPALSPAPSLVLALNHPPGPRPRPEHVPGSPVTAPGSLVTAPAAPSGLGPSPSPAPSLVRAPNPASGSRQSLSHAFRARAWFLGPSSALGPDRRDPTMYPPGES